jgi:hypothetical protein
VMNLLLCVCCSNCGAKLSRVAGAPPFPALTPFPAPFYVLEGVDPSTMFSLCFFVTRWTSLLLASQIPVPGSSWGPCRLVLFYPEVIAIPNSNLRCQFQLSSSFLGIATTCCLDPLLLTAFLTWL